MSLVGMEGSLRAWRCGRVERRARRRYCRRGQGGRADGRWAAAIPVGVPAERRARGVEGQAELDAVGMQQVAHGVVRRPVGRDIDQSEGVAGGDVGGETQLVLGDDERVGPADATFDLDERDGAFPAER